MTQLENTLAHGWLILPSLYEKTNFHPYVVREIIEILKKCIGVNV